MKEFHFEEVMNIHEIAKSFSEHWPMKIESHPASGIGRKQKRRSPQPMEEFRFDKVPWRAIVSSI
jgi:hypothetical protein